MMEQQHNKGSLASYTVSKLVGNSQMKTIS